MRSMIETPMSFTELLTFANLIADLVLLFRLALAKLAPRYPFLVIYLIIDALGSAGLSFIPRLTDLYFHSSVRL